MKESKILIEECAIDEIRRLLFDMRVLKRNDDLRERIKRADNALSCLSARRDLNNKIDIAIREGDIESAKEWCQLKNSLLSQWKTYIEDIQRDRYKEYEELAKL